MLVFLGTCFHLILFRRYCFVAIETGNCLYFSRQENQSTQDANDNEDVEEEVDDGPLLVPRVKVAEDGSIILDEER